MNRSTGAWQFDPKDKLALVCRSLAQATQELNTAAWDRTFHVKGHSGHGWNELADGLAKSTVTTDFSLPVHGDIGDWVRTGDIAHLWLLLAAFRDPVSWPQHLGSHMVDTAVEFGQRFPPLCPGLQQAADAKRGGPDPRPVTSEWQQFRLVSLNVQTLADDPAEPCSHFEGRIGYLRDQFEWIGAHIVAIQRREPPGQLLCPQATIFDSALELVLRDTLAWRGGFSVRLRTEQLGLLPKI